MSGEVRQFVADNGERIELRDVVDGHFTECIPAMQIVHEEAFPEHPFARDAMLDDAVAPSHREGIVLHQWYLTVDDEPAGIVMFDSNLVRRVAPLHFIAVRPHLRDVRLDGTRMGTWVMSVMLDAAVRDGADLGCVAETPRITLKIFLRADWTEIGEGYLEPVHGWDWPDKGLETRPLALAWMMPPLLDPQVGITEISHRAAAAYLLDTYRLPIDLDWVVAQTGEQRHRVGPSRN